MYLALLIFSAWFSYVDLRYHRITNRALAIFSVVLSCWFIVEKSDLNLISASLVFLFSILCYRFGLGAGDVKLASLLSLFYLPNTLVAVSDALTGFLVISSLSILVHLIFGRKLTDSIALAPAICGAFIWCAR